MYNGEDKTKKDNEQKESQKKKRCGEQKRAKNAGMFTDVTGCCGNQTRSPWQEELRPYFLLCDGFSEHGSHERLKKKKTNPDLLFI